MVHGVLNMGLAGLTLWSLIVTYTSDPGYITDTVLQEVSRRVVIDHSLR